MSRNEKRIKNLVYTYINEQMGFILQLKEFIINNVTNTVRTIKLQGEVTGVGTLHSSSNLKLTATIPDDSHTHDDINIENKSSRGLPNTLVATDDDGNIFTTGTSHLNTGYKLNNGKDIGTLFHPRNTPITVYNKTVVNDNAPVIELKVNNIDKSITLIHNTRNTTIGNTPDLSL